MSGDSVPAAAVLAPRLQLALDHTDLPSALRVLQLSAPWVDVIEVGTVLCLSEGMRAVRIVRALFPDRPVLADIRIAEAGSLLARLALEAGASWVSVVAGASLTTVEQVCRVAHELGGQVQVELGEGYDIELAKAWRAAGVRHVIVKRSRDAEAAGSLRWGADDLDRIDELASLGFTVTVTGGVTPEDLPTFAGHPVSIVIAGRAVYDAEDPAAAAAELQRALARVWR